MDNDKLSTKTAARQMPFHGCSCRALSSSLNRARRAVPTQPSLITMEPSWSPPPSPGQRRKTLPGLRRPRGSAYADLSRPDTVPVKGGRSIRPFFTSDLGRGNTREGPGVDNGSCFGDEWMKASWRKGECRQEIKLVAAVSGLTFDEARIVALRLYNHFHWLSQLHKRSEHLRILVGKEKRHLHSVTQQKQKPPTGKSPSREGVDTDKGFDCRQEGAVSEGESVAEKHQRSPLESRPWQQGEKDDGSCGSADARGVNQGDFSCYVRGLCTLCREGTFDQVLSLMLRVYSTAREEQLIGRAELAAILESHIVYDDFENPQEEKERVYRWLKRQFIELAFSRSSLADTLSIPISGSTQDLGNPNATATTPGPHRLQSRGGDGCGGSGGNGRDYISWENARAVLRRGPHDLQDSLVVDLPRLSKDLWAADLADAQRTSLLEPRTLEDRP